MQHNNPKKLLIAGILMLVLGIVTVFFSYKQIHINPLILLVFGIFWIIGGINGINKSLKISKKSK